MRISDFSNWKLQFVANGLNTNRLAKALSEGIRPFQTFSATAVISGEKMSGRAFSPWPSNLMSNLPKPMTPLEVAEMLLEESRNSRRPRPGVLSRNALNHTIGGWRICKINGHRDPLIVAWAIWMRSR